MCLERNRPGGQTPSSERVRHGIDTNFLCGPEVTLEFRMRKHWVKREATGTEWTWRWATTSKTQDETARAGWLWMTRTLIYLEPRSAQCVLMRNSVLWHAPGSVSGVHTPSSSVSCVWHDAKMQLFLYGGQRSRILSWVFSWSILLRFPWVSLYFRNSFIDYLWSDHLSSFASCVVAILSKSKTTRVSSTRM